MSTTIKNPGRTLARASAAKGIRTGEEYVRGLNDGRRLFIDGKLVTDVTGYAPLKGVISTIAGMFDVQHTPEYQDIITYVSPATGHRVSKTYMPASTLEEFQDRLRCDYARTDLTYGYMGRLTDFMSAILLDLEAGLRAIGKTGAADKVDAYIEYCRENDLQITHALLDPQSDRSKPDAPNEAVRVVERRPDGIVVSGVRMLSTLAPVADECYVGPYFPRKPGEEEYTLTFVLPMNAPGLKIVARETYDKGASLFDRPLTGRFDEGDAILVFDNVFVPTERLLIDGDVEAYNKGRTNAAGYVGIQAITRSTAKLRFLTGLCSTVAHANGRDKTPRFQAQIGELVGLLALSEGMQQGACVDAARRVEARRHGQLSHVGDGISEPTHQASMGAAALNFFYPWVNTKAIECLRFAAGSGAIAMSEADYQNPEIQPLLDKWLIGPGIDAEHRLQLMKLVWDASSTEFGSRQALYERLYSGDPERNAQIWFMHPKRVEAEGMVKRLLGW
ncbi:MAG: 4-hydroxyphenylacetate 3-hydroxylase [Herminiimonas sp.]|nr:4-hydroxyphenylacetate 3-hydroxylase [Herminiimonas sp.]